MTLKGLPALREKMNVTISRVIAGVKVSP